MGHLDVGHHADSSSTARRHSELRPGTSVHLRRQPAEGKQFRQEDSLPRRSALKPTAQPVQAHAGQRNDSEVEPAPGDCQSQALDQDPGLGGGQVPVRGAEVGRADTRLRDGQGSGVVVDVQLQAAEGGQPGATRAGRVGQVGRGCGVPFANGCGGS